MEKSFLTFAAVSLRVAVAIALRNRWRRQQVAEPLRHEITPKNILMIGPTGVGKTEIARRLAKLAEAPFIKIEATKFTEVGYVGRDVDTIIRDLIDIGIKQTRALEMKKVRARAEDAAEDRIIDILVPPARDFGFTSNTAAAVDSGSGDSTRQTFRKRLRQGELDDKEIEIELADAGAQMEIMAPPGMEEMTEQIKSMFSGVGAQRKKARKVKIREALKLLVEEEAAKLVNDEELKQKASPEEASAAEACAVDNVRRPQRRQVRRYFSSEHSRDRSRCVSGAGVSGRHAVLEGVFEEGQ